MKIPLISTVASVAALAAGLAGAQTYYPSAGYGAPYGYAGNQVRVVRCESINSRRNFCGVDTRGGVQVYRQLSSKNCIRGRNWQATSSGITVDDGCRAEFALGSGYGQYQSYNSGSTGYYTTDRYGRRVYVPASSMSNGGYTTDRYGRRIYDDRYSTNNGTYNGGYTTDRYGRRIYTQTYPSSAYPYPQEPYDSARDIYYDNRDAGPYGTVPSYSTTPYPTTGYEEVIQCRSTATGRTYCGDRTRTYNIRYSSNANCIEGRTYGRDSYGTWVSGGCNMVLEPGGYEE